MSTLNIPLTDNWVQLSRSTAQYTRGNVMDLAKDPMEGASLSGLTRIGRPQVPVGTVLKSARIVFDLLSTPSAEGYLEVDQLNGGNLSSADGYFTGLSVATDYRRLITPATSLGEHEIDISYAFINTYGFIGLRYRIIHRNDGPSASTINVTIKPKHIVLEFEYIPNAPVNLFPKGGESVYGITDITWSPPSTVTAPTNELHYEVQFTPNNSQTWSAIGTTDIGVTSLSYDFSNIPETSLAKVRVRAVYGTTPGAWITSAGVFSIKRDIAPYAPINLAPSGIIVDRSLTQRLSWKHNDPNPNDIQSKAEIQYRKQGILQWTTQTVHGANNELYIAPDVLPTGQIEWRVRTYDQSGLVSLYSNISVFTSADPTNAPTIISPSSVSNVSRPVIEWTGGAQQSYQIVITDSLNAVVWDTDEVSSGIKARTVGVDLINGATYKIKVRIKDASGLFSSFAEKNIVISYTPPANPVANTFTNDTSIVVDWENPEPTDAQPIVLSNDVYKLINNEWVRIAVNVPSPFEDMSAVSGKQESYYVQANGSNNSSSQSSIVVDTLILESPILSSTNDDELYMVLKHMTATAKQKTRGRTLTEFAGRSRALAEFGESESEGFSFGWISQDRAEVESFYDLIDRRETLLYRDAEGRKEYVSIDSTNETESHGGAVFNLSFSADVVYYREGV